MATRNNILLAKEEGGSVLVVLISLWWCKENPVYYVKLHKGYQDRVGVLTLRFESDDAFATRSRAEKKQMALLSSFVNVAAYKVVQGPFSGVADIGKAELDLDQVKKYMAPEKEGFKVLGGQRHQLNREVAVANQRVGLIQNLEKIEHQKAWGVGQVVVCVDNTGFSHDFERGLGYVISSRSDNPSYVGIKDKSGILRTMEKGRFRSIEQFRSCSSDGFLTCFGACDKRLEVCRMCLLRDICEQV